ncbi:unnamed protein product [Meloidogyne enterolobii]|uniref:Uncharacterized protein n=1 Tax=Meloidogyne enterolobii TaxID=390850 RepID=A0ACB0Z5R1_MELEN
MNPFSFWVPNKFNKYIICSIISFLFPDNFLYAVLCCRIFSYSRQFIFIKGTFEFFPFIVTQFI